MARPPTPPTNPVPFRQRLDLLGWLLRVHNLRCRIKFHVGRPLWLRHCLASFLARWPLYLLPSWVLSFLGFVRKWFLLSCLDSVDCFWFCFWLLFLLSNRTKCCPFLFFVFCLGSLCLRLVPQEGNRKSHGKNSWLFWPKFGLNFYYGFLLVRMDNQEQRGFAPMLRLTFMGSSFLRGRFCIINSGKQTGLVVRNVRFWLVSPGFSSSLLSSSSFPVACRRNRRLLLLSRRLDDASSPPPPPIPEGSSPQIVWLLFGFFLSSLPPLRC